MYINVHANRYITYIEVSKRRGGVHFSIEPNGFGILHFKKHLIYLSISIYIYVYLYLYLYLILLSVYFVALSRIGTRGLWHRFLGGGRRHQQNLRPEACFAAGIKGNFCQSMGRSSIPS